MAFDNRNVEELDPRILDDKIKVYERQVKDWFLIPAERLSKSRNMNNGFLVLMGLLLVLLNKPAPNVPTCTCKGYSDFW